MASAYSTADLVSAKRSSWITRLLCFIEVHSWEYTPVDDGVIRRCCGCRAKEFLTNAEAEEVRWEQMGI